MKDKTLVISYTGTGKTETAKRYSNVVDLDFTDYKYIYDKSARHLPVGLLKGNDKVRTENPDYPQNFINAALNQLGRGYIVMSAFIEFVYDAITSEEFSQRAKDVRIILVCPTRNDWEEYATRFRARGNSEEFITKRETEFVQLVNLFETANGMEKITIKPGQFLDSALIKYGINLQPK